MLSRQSTHKQTDSIGQLSELFEEEGDANSPAEPTVPRRARSFNDFRSAVRPFHGRHGLGQPPSKAQRSKVRSWEALLVDGPVAGSPADDEDAGWIDDGLLEYSQREHMYGQAVSNQRNSY